MNVLLFLFLLLVPVAHGGSGGNLKGLTFVDFQSEVAPPARIWMPEVGDAKQRRLPLVLLAHGNGYTLEDYGFLVSALVHEGFVVACVGAPDDAEIDERADGLVAFLDRAFVRYAGSLNGDVVFLGHSRGGEAVLHAANKLVGSSYMVRAVISMAPSFEEEVEPLSSAATTGLLVLYGSHDGDVTGMFSDDAPMESPFGVYDAAFPTPVPGRKKLMFYLHGGSHAGFSDDAEMRDLPEEAVHGLVNTNRQRMFTRAVVVAFLRWMIADDREARTFLLERKAPRDWPYFSGDASPDAQFAPAFSTLYAATPVLVVDDFEGPPRINSTGGAVVADAQVQVDNGPHYLLDRHSPHLGKGLSVRWTAKAGKTPGLTFELKSPHNRVRGAGYLTFNIAQRYKDPFNKDDTVDFHLVLRDLKGHSAKAKVSDWETVRYPVACFSEEPGEDATKSGMVTVRVPLYAFQGVDFDDLKALDLVFDVPRADGRNTGGIILDDIDFIP